jgi:hypothetical protein
MIRLVGFRVPWGGIRTLPSASEAHIKAVDRVAICNGYEERSTPPAQVRDIASSGEGSHQLSVPVETVHGALSPARNP